MNYSFAQINNHSPSFSGNTRMLLTLVCICILVTQHAFAVAQEDRSKPARPVHADHTVADPPTQARAVALEMRGPLPSAPKNDRLVSLTPAPPFMGGTLVYSEYVPIPGEMRGWGGIVLRKLDTTALDPITTYYITPPVQVDHSIEPQFVGGGRYLVFKEGYYPYDRHALFSIYILDLQTHRLISGPAIGFYFPTIKVSPDGRYFALVQGGDSLGYSAHGEKMGIVIYDVKTQQYHETSLSEEGPTLAWTNQGTLLYSAPGPPYKDKHGAVLPHDPVIKGINNMAPLGAIFETPAGGGRSELILRNGDSPVPSSDGKWMFFWGWPDSAEGANNVLDPAVQGEGYFTFYFYDRTTRKRHILPYGIIRSQDRLLWMSDSKRILRLRDSYEPDGSAGCELSTLQFVVDGKPDFAPKAQVITTLHAKDFQLANHSETRPQFQPLHFSRDGEILYFRNTEITGIDTTNHYRWKHTLEAVDLRTGTVTDLAQTHDDMGMDFLEPASQVIDSPGAVTHSPVLPPQVSISRP